MPTDDADHDDDDDDDVGTRGPLPPRGGAAPPIGFPPRPRRVAPPLHSPPFVPPTRGPNPATPSPTPPGDKDLLLLQQNRSQGEPPRGGAFASGIHADRGSDAAADDDDDDDDADDDAADPAGIAVPPPDDDDDGSGSWPTHDAGTGPGGIPDRSPGGDHAAPHAPHAPPPPHRCLPCVTLRRACIGLATTGTDALRGNAGALRTKIIAVGVGVFAAGERVKRGTKSMNAAGIRTIAEEKSEFPKRERV